MVAGLPQSARTGVTGDAVGCPGFLPPQAVMAMLNNKGRSHVDFMM